MMKTRRARFTSAVSAAVRPLDHPMPGDVADQRRQDDNAGRTDPRTLQQYGKGRHHQQQDRELPQLDPEIEGQQRQQQVGAGKLQLLLEYEGEAEAVDQAEGAGDEPPPA